MQQSPEKKLPAGRRDKYGGFDDTDAGADRRMYRGAQPKARKSALRENEERPQRGNRPAR